MGRMLRAALLSRDDPTSKRGSGLKSDSIVLPRGVRVARIAAGSATLGCGGEYRVRLSLAPPPPLEPEAEAEAEEQAAGEDETAADASKTQKRRQKRRQWRWRVLEASVLPDWTPEGGPPPSNSSPSSSAAAAALPSSTAAAAASDGGGASNEGESGAALLPPGALAPAARGMLRAGLEARAWAAADALEEAEDEDEEGEGEEEKMEQDGGDGGDGGEKKSRAKAASAPPPPLPPLQLIHRALRSIAARLIAGQVDVVLLTTSMQLINLLRIAEEEGIAQQVREALQSAFIGSIGPTTSETLEDCGLKADFEPSHPKMGLLVNEAAGLAAAALANKR